MRLIKNTTSILLLLLGVLCAVAQAQSVLPPAEPRLAEDEVKAFSIDICIGSSVSVNGQLFQWSVTVSVLSVKTSQGEVVDHNGVVSPEATTQYILTYRTSTGETRTETSTVTVWKPAYIRLVGDTAGGDVCHDQELSFRVDSAAYVQGMVRWTLSTGEVADYGDQFSFTPTQSCKLYINASNDYCGANERVINFNYHEKLEFTSVGVSYGLPDYASCSDCLFDLPDGSDWKINATEGEIKNVKITWNDGSTGERSLVEGRNLFQCHAVFAVSMSNVCDSISTEINKTIYLSVRGLRCEPEVYNYETVLSPCEWTPVYLVAPDVDTNHIISYANALFTVNPMWEELEVRDTVLYKTYSSINSTGWEQVFYLRPHNIDKEQSETEFAAVYRADYTIACPYSKTVSTIAKSVNKNGVLRWENKWFDIGYTYCDRYPGKLEIGGRKTWLKIDAVMFDNIPADSMAFKFNSLNQKHYNTVHTIRTQINPNYDLYKELELRIAVSRDMNDCHFKDTVVQKVELQAENYCNPYYTSNYDWNPLDYSRHCVGSVHMITFQAPLYYQHIDSLKILSSDFKLSYTIEYTADSRRYTCFFQPYFVSETEENRGTQNGEVSWVGYYHDIETNEVLCDTFPWEFELCSCPPIVQNALNPDCRPRNACLSCPGSEWISSVAFPNPSTDKSKIKISWTKPPIGQNFLERLDSNSFFGDSLIRKVHVASYAALWRSHFWLYDSSDFRLEITYNEGDSLRTMYMDSSFRINPACVPRLVAQRDSCCVGDSIKWHIYADFYKYFLQGAQWENPSSEVHSRGIENHSYATTPNRVRPRLAYHTFVEQPGLYPYTVQYVVNDTMLTHSDTLRIYAVKKPKIFISDSAYVCAGSSVDVGQYIDSSMVREIEGVSRPSELILTKVAANRVYPLTARMRYTCDHGDRITNNLHILAEDDVYLDCLDTTRLVCPLDSVHLEVSSNGRLHWIKQCWKDGVLEPQRDTIFKYVRHFQPIYNRVIADSALYTVVAFTACPKPPETETFKAINQPIPKIAFYNLHTCYPDSLHPTFVASDASIADNKVQWFLNDEERWPPYAPTYDTTPIRVMALGENGCWAKAEDSIYSYRPPTLQLFSSLCFHAGEIDTLVLTGADRYIWRGSGRVDETDAARYILTARRDTVVYATGMDLTTGCITIDTLSVWLYAPRIKVAIDTLCRLAEWKQPFVGDSLTRIEWYNPAMSLSGQDSLGWPSLQLSDTGLYTRISYRVSCVDTQHYYLRLYSLPQSCLQGRDVLCEHDTLTLLHANNAQELYPGENAFMWYAPNGQPLESALSADTIYYSRNDVQTADSGWYAMQMTYGVCQWLDSLHLTVYPIPYPALPTDTFFCENHYVDLDAFNPDYPDGVYKWQDGLRPEPGAGDEEQLTMMRMRDSGTYTATLTVNGCTGEKVVKVEERPLPVFYMPIDTLVCRGVECMFYLPDHYDAYAWYEDSSANAVGFDSWQGYKNYGRVWVEVTHRGCADTLETFIDRVFCGRLYFPTAFTPNGNNVNDSFGPISVAEPEDLYYELTIVNPNNQVVFHSTNPKEMWDGTFKGVPCPPDTYMYNCRASVRRSGRDVSMSGRIVLIR